MRGGKAPDAVEPETQGQRSVGPGLQRAVRIAPIDVGRAHLDVAIANVANDLGGSVKPHGLTVEQSAGEGRRIMTLEPGRGIDEMREGSGMAFREAVAAEALDLTETPLGKFLLVAATGHAPDELFPKAFDRAGMPMRGHRPAQPIGLTRRKPCGNDGDPHRLFLKQRHAERLGEHLLEFSGRI